ncbi:MAG: nitroreductase family protein [Bacteroidetes bacterium]|nr:nitroreductase family protein [Bacteroidota bacterium]
MNFYDLAQLRQSTRKYSSKQVERDKIDKIIESCRLAPSACNSQPWKFIVIDDANLKKQISDSSYGSVLRFNRFANECPVMAALIIEPPKLLAKIGGAIKDKDFFFMDIGIVASYFCLQAAELGLGTCMLGWFDEPKVKKLLEIPSGKRVALLFTLGYEAGKQRTKIRKNINDIFSYNKY